MSTLPLLPDTTWPRPAALPRPLKLAIGLSVGLHLALLAQQGWKPEQAAELPRPLQVVLRVPQPAPEAPPPARPAVTMPAEAQPVHRTPPPVATQAPRPTPILTRPARPEAAPAPIVRAAEPAAPPPATPALAADNTPRPPAPAANPTPVAAPRVDVTPFLAADEPPDPALLERYGRSLSSLFARHQQYPRLAAMRGWEGEVQVRITIARKGNIVATQVVRSSGFEVLDQNAVQLVTNTGTLPRPPEALQNKEIQIVVPVLFKLDKPA